MTSVSAQLARIFARQFPTLAQPVEEASVRSVEAWDSIAHINLILAVEQEFGVTFTPEEATVTDSFAALRDFVEERAG